jgi:hypothetical protein
MIKESRQTIYLHICSKETELQTRLFELDAARTNLHSDYYWDRRQELMVKLEEAIKMKSEHEGNIR